MNDVVGRKLIKWELTRNKYNPKNTKFLTVTRPGFWNSPSWSVGTKITLNFNDNLHGFGSRIKRRLQYWGSGGKKHKRLLLGLISSLMNRCLSTHRLIPSVGLSLPKLRHKLPSPRCTRNNRKSTIRNTSTVLFFIKWWSDTATRRRKILNFRPLKNDIKKLSSIWSSLRCHFCSA